MQSRIFKIVFHAGTDISFLSIRFNKEKPFLQKATPFYSEVDEGWWIIYSDYFLTEKEVLSILENDELLDRYLE